MSFLFHASAAVSDTPADREQEHERQQHAASEAGDDIDCSGTKSDDDNESTHTYIISRSSFTAATGSSTTPYAVTSTDTADLLNNLSLTEDEQTVSSFSIEPPTSSMSIEMADQQRYTTTATSATATTTSAETNSADLAPRGVTQTTVTTTTSSSIEEDIEEAIEISEVEEQLNSNIDSLSDVGGKGPSKHIAKSESSDEAAQFGIDDAQLSGGQLAQHFLADEESDDEDADPPSPKNQATATDDDDFDISLPLEGRKPMHSRYEDNAEESPHRHDEGESLSNQSTTDDVSDFVDEPQQTTDSAIEPQNAQSGSVAASTMASALSEAAEPESRLADSELEEGVDAHSEQDHSMEEIVATNESIEITYNAEEGVASSSLLSASQNQNISAGLDVAEPAETCTVEQLKLPQLQSPQIVDYKTTNILETVRLEPEPLDRIMVNLKGDDDEDEDKDEECAMQLLKLRLMAMNQQTQVDTGAKGSPTESPASQDPGTMELKQMERVPLTEFSKDVLEDITEESERLLSISTTAEDPKSLSMEESKTLQETKVGSNSSLVSLNMLKQLESKVQDLHSQLESKDNCLASLNLQLEAARQESSVGPASARDSSSLVTSSTEYRTFLEEFGAPVRHSYNVLTIGATKFFCCIPYRHSTSTWSYRGATR